ncbi:hypothetical protein SIM91_04845 [Rhodococcus opacus]|uniref:TOTE conflict system archaeo-eukaryotic primase domain-containing protein n=1 Tax=Rhodococcus opacus TaxID=37919 RepID=UPI00224BCF3A|nr:hypothetical protein [Rhodococcus opacus]MDX5962650.1 hypothetical protein [Rhodococcus opacus]CAG7636079.1 hypothetical protein E143388_07754 [Rhodococcus opacus]
MSAGWFDGSAHLCADPSATHNNGVTVVTPANWRHTYYQAFHTWSPRATARVDPDGKHSYVDAPLPEQLPSIPVAMYLADVHGTFRFLAFDFDATDTPTIGLPDSVADTIAFTSTLRSLRIPYLVTASGSQWGRHVWIRLANPVAARTVRSLAHLVKRAHRSLDLSPLTNPRTGCVRIPASAHRSGTCSTPVLADPAGDPNEQLALFSAGATMLDLRRLTKHLTMMLTVLDTAGTSAPTPPERRPRPVETPTALSGPTIVGTRTPGIRLDEASDGHRSALHATLSTPIALNDDHSGPAFAVLLRMAANGWSSDDVLTAARTAPALEYLRTSRYSGTGRTERPNAHQFAARQWSRAVTAWNAWTDTNPRRSRTVIDNGGRVLAQQIQQAADTDRSLWTGHAGVHRRCVLDALCLVAWETGRTEFDIDQRRLALTAGVTQPTASRSLSWLRDNGWITRIDASRGARSDRYRMEPPPTACEVESQGVPAPDPTLGSHLHQLLLHARHDLWTAPGLGGPCGATHRALLSGHHGVASLVHATGHTPALIAEHLEQLQDLGLVTRCGRAVQKVVAVMAAAATRLGVAGVVEARQRLYTAESLMWEWWQRELTWRRAPRLRKPIRAEHPIPLLRGRFPTKPDGRADFAGALGRLLASLSRASALEAA